MFDDFDIDYNLFHFIGVYSRNDEKGACTKPPFFLTFDTERHESDEQRGIWTEGTRHF